jgi:hypothetical protein
LSIVLVGKWLAVNTPRKMSNNKEANTKDHRSSTSVVWRNLVDWVQTEHGGHVHTALNLAQGQDGDETNRGVVATRSITKGELLIRLPASCVLSGKILLSCQKYHKLQTKSSWMQCVAAYYHSKNNSNSNSSGTWKPYFDSLPKTYETLFQWKDKEIQTYLRGTTLGTMVQADREDKSMQTRYQQAVKPVLQELDLLLQQSANGKEEMEAFLETCMCISTRGFHYSSSDSSSTQQQPLATTQTDSYQGPFLLPVIDLLNHNPPQSCTTLQCHEGTFFMMADRPITQGESIVHSYGDSLTAAQLLQTFGFVMPPSAATTTTTNNAGTLASCLSKNQHLLPACQAIKQSGIPRRLQTKMKDIDEQETWDVADLPVRDTEILADDVLIGNSSSSISSIRSSLTDELITFVCLQFLPEEAYQELQDDNGEVSLLDASILDDLYLGVLVCRSLLLAISKKLDQYDDDTPESKDACMCVITDNVPGRIASLLEQEAPTLRHEKSRHRSFYGWAIRTEELTSLQTLCTNVSSVMGCLYEELKRPTAEYETLSSNKRPKVQYDE